MEEQIVKQFGNEMLKKMTVRRERYKELGWRDPKYKTLLDLVGHLNKEVEEYRTALTHKDEREELIDVAICCLMLWDRLGLDKEKKK